jgi:hypothetical protein
MYCFCSAAIRATARNSSLRASFSKARAEDNSHEPQKACVLPAGNLVKGSNQGVLEMAKRPPVEIKEIGDDAFVMVDGVKIAMRGSPDSAYAGTWMATEPGWSVIELDDESI